MGWSVRARITIVASVVVLLLLAITGAGLVATQRIVLTDSVDEVLQRASADVVASIDAGTLTDPIPGRGDEEAFAQVTGADGRVVAATTHAVHSAAFRTPESTGLAFQDLKAGGQHYRILTRLHDGFVVRVGTPMDDVDDSVQALIRGLVVSIPAATVLLAVLVWLLVGRVLRPVEEIRTQVAEISGGSLDRRVPEPRALDEIGRLARTMNGMLDRLERSADHQRRFVADASHELRTPLARIRAEIDLGLVSGDTADSETALRSVSDDVDSLEKLVQDLLVLARSDSGASTTRRSPVDLDDVVLREAERARTRGGANIDLSGVSAAQVCGDPSQLSRVVRNILDNAIVHGGGTIAVSLVEEDGYAVLDVKDDGPGVPPALQERMFERFTRADVARAPTRGGTGLGLSIAREIVQAHGGTIRFDPHAAVGTRIVARIPSASF